MFEQYSIGNKFDLAEELSFEPIGCYYRAVSLDGEENLLLLLNSEASEHARLRFAELTSSLNQLEDDPAFVPVLDIINFIEGVALVMPYYKGKTLAEYIDSTNPQQVSNIKKILRDTAKSLSSLHKDNKYYGFINFSTAWVTTDESLKLIGYGILDKIFNNFNLQACTSELNNPRIVSCLNPKDNNQIISCNKHVDYYAIYIIFVSLLQGYIAANNKLDTDLINKSLSTASKVYLTSTFCNKFYKENVSIDDWLAKLKPTASISILYPAASVLAITVGSGLFYGVMNYINSNHSDIVTTIVKFEKTENGLALVPNQQQQDISKASTDKKLSTIEQSQEPDVKPDPELTQLEHEFVENRQDEGILDKLASATDQSPQSANEPVPELEVTDLKQKSNTTINIANSKLSHEQEIVAKKILKNTGLKCTDKSCHDLISAGIKGPELANIKVGPNNSLIMRKPVTRNDYYIYCYIEKDCNLNSEFDENVITKCLFAGECSKNLEQWLRQPMEFVSSYQIKKYINWLNNVTLTKYDILPDQTWTTLASSLSPDNSCQVNKENNFIAYSQYPEWVKINNTIAMRGPVQVTSDGEQCSIALTTTDTDEYLGKVYVRLSRNA